MERSSWRVGALLVALLLCAFIGACAAPPVQTDTVYFSPRGGCTVAIVRNLDAARESVLVQAYSFTSQPIAEALVKAHRRGVNVQVILDKSQRKEKHSVARLLNGAGIPIFFDDKYAIAHNKVMVIDGRVVITGSFNFTKAAEESNAENLVVIEDEEIASIYAQNWQNHLARSTPYEQPQSHPF
jgi:phosphatidylserine/phosphatidylglycerophosphate/cardiolipin synthase-like enzyme